MKIYPKVSKYDNLSATFFKLSDEEVTPLNEEISLILEKIKDDEKELQKYANNIKLAGQIEHQYILNDSVNNHIERILLPAVKHYVNQHTPLTFLTISDRQNLDNLTINNVKDNPCWVNLQKKYEYNPLHRHSGMLSFVIWLKVPYSSENEKNYSNSIKSLSSKRNSSLNGDFCFIKMNNNIIEQTPLGVDQTWENRGVLFSSDLFHAVYPFYTSNEYRISISGNYFVR